MATAAPTLRLSMRRCQQCRIWASNVAANRIPIPREFSTSLLRQEAEPPNSSPEKEETQRFKAEMARKRAGFSSGPQFDDEFIQQKWNKIMTTEEARELRREDELKVLKEIQKDPKFKRARPYREPSDKTRPTGLLSMGADPEEDLDEDPEFEEDEITSMAHDELEQHRELREYARLAAWEMPLLTKMAKPFEPPTEKQVLRFRYTTYMGEQHPAEKKVVVEFCPGDMPDLTPLQTDKLKKLVGARYNPETEIIKMSCEMFENQAQNKRYLGDLVDTLLREARDPTDTFEDVPLDTRHHPIKIKPKFPVEWRMTDQRRTELEAARQLCIQTDQQKALQGAIVDGVAQITASLQRRVDIAQAQQIPLTVPAGNPKGKRVSIRR